MASGALDGPGGRVLSLSLTPTADGRAIGTLRFVDHAAKVRLRAQRIESLRVEQGVTTVLATAVVGRARGSELSVVVRAPSKPDERTAVRLDVTGPAGSYHAEGELVGGVTRLPAGRIVGPAASARPPASGPPAPVTRSAPVDQPSAPAPGRSGIGDRRPASSAPPAQPPAPASSPPESPPPAIAQPPPAAPSVALAVAALAAQAAGVVPPAPEPPATAASGAEAVVDGLAATALSLVRRLDVAPAAAPEPPRAPSHSPTALPPPAPVTQDAPSPLTFLLGRLAASTAPPAVAAIADGPLDRAPADQPAHGAAPPQPPASTAASPSVPAALSPAGQALALLGARLAEDPELAGPARALAAELRPLLAAEAAAHPAEAQAIGRSLESAVASAQRERGPGTEVAFAALVDRALQWRRTLGPPEGIDRRVAREVFSRYGSLSESWARAAAAAAAEQTPPNAWAAATALGISLVEQDALFGAGEAALTRELAGAGAAGAGALPLTAAGAGGRTSTARLGEVDFAIPDGHFFTQAGRPERAGFAVTDQDGVPFWSAFQQLGGVPALGYPASHRFAWDGFTVQVFQRAVLQWRPETGEVYLVNVLDRLHAGGLDGWLLYARQTPPHGLGTADVAALDAYPALRDAYAGDGPAIHGMPTSGVVDMGNHFAVRTQRTVLQLWTHDVPWAKRGDVTVALAGDMVKESGLLPDPWALEPLPWIETS